MSKVCEGPHVVAVTPVTLLNTVDTGILINMEQNGLAEALFALRARSTLSLLHTARAAIAASRSLPRMRGTSLAKADATRDPRNTLSRVCILFQTG